MNYLLDTQLLLWSTLESDRLTRKARQFIADPAHDFWFSSASIWEVAIKFKKFPDTFRADPRVLVRGLEELGYRELTVTSQHAQATARLPLIHKDPFDRLLVAQSLVEGIILATTDAEIVRYEIASLFLS